MGNRHNVFISYHHANDEYYRREFERLFHNVYDILVTRAVGMGDIDTNLNTEAVRQKIRDEYIRSASVTVVLVGRETWRRKHVDWEISSSLRKTQRNSRTGLLGILLPDFPGKSWNYDKSVIPPRLYDNVESGYARLYDWSSNPSQVQGWIHEAFLSRNSPNPINSRELFSKNRSSSGWY